MPLVVQLKWTKYEISKTRSSFFTLASGGFPHFFGVSTELRIILPGFRLNCELTTAKLSVFWSIRDCVRPNSFGVQYIVGQNEAVRDGSKECGELGPPITSPERVLEGKHGQRDMCRMAHCKEDLIPVPRSA